MTDTGRRAGARMGEWLERHPYVLPVLILLAGACFRFYNLDWDDGQYLHPDERQIFMVIAGADGNPPLALPTSWSQFFDVQAQGGSPLNPHFFDYGSLPFYLLGGIAGLISILGQHVPVMSQWAGVDSFAGLLMLGRGVSAAIDLASVLFLFLLARAVFGYWTAVVAMAFAAFTVLDVQLSHYYTVDTLLMPLCLLTLLAAVAIVRSNARRAYIFAGIAFGAAMATKTTGLLLVIPLGSAALLGAWSASPWPCGGSLRQRFVRHYAAVAPAVNLNLQWLLLTYLIGAATFAVLEPYGILDRTQLVSDIAQQNMYLVTNNPPFVVPYTIQYAHTIPYVYQIANILFWDQGIPLALTAFAGTLVFLLRNLSVRYCPEQAVLLLWVFPYFLFVGSFFAKFSRYMLPILPVISLFGAALVVVLIRSLRGRLRFLAWGALAAAVSLTFLYSLAYMNIYEHANTRVAASRWIYANIPAGTTIATEGAWDDPLPLGVDGKNGGVYHYAGIDPNSPGLNLYNPDDQNKLANLVNVLTHARYIVMSSERMVGSIPKLPSRYPLTVRYYHLLFAGKLGFTLERVFQQHPQLGPVVVHDYPADESFHVYDHPIVRIFKQTHPLAASTLRSMLTAGLSYNPSAAQYEVAAAGPAEPRDTRLMLTARQWREDQTSGTLDDMFPPHGFAMSHPILVWWLLLELLGLLAFPLVFVLLGNLPDRGFVIGKTVGLLVACYLVWIAVSLGIATYDRGVIYLAVAVLAIASLGLAYRVRGAMTAYVREQWRMLAWSEVVFLAGFTLFLLLRMWYPDLGHQFSPVSASNIGDGRMGEKQMELAFLNAIVRSRVFPPYDPFFAHGYINYYYYGFYLVGTLCKLTQIMPSTGFNLAIATFFGLLVGGTFSVVLALTRRVTPGIAGAAFVGLFGNLGGAQQLVSGLQGVAAIHSAFPFFGGLADCLSGFWQVLTAGAMLPSFDYWTPTRIVPPGDISEFPYFTYLFADLHPHLIAYPMTVAALALAVNLLLSGSGGGWRLAGSLLLGGVVVGAIAVTNPWDFPTYLVVIGIGALVGSFVIRRRLNIPMFVRPAAWMLALAVLSLLLYYPFKATYQTVFATGIGLVRDVTPQMLENGGVCPPGQTNCPEQVRQALATPLSIYLEHFGLFLYILASYLITLLLLRAGCLRLLQRASTTVQFGYYHREQLSRVRRAFRGAARMRRPHQRVIDPSILVGVLILVIGLAVLQYFLLAFLVAFGGLAILLIDTLARRLRREQLFILALLLVPVVLSVGTQVFFVKDWLAGGTMFRMNTIFKFYNQAWVLYGVSAAAALTFFVTEHRDWLTSQRQYVDTARQAAESNGHLHAGDPEDLRALHPLDVSEHVPAEALIGRAAVEGVHAAGGVVAAHAVTYADQPEGAAPLAATTDGTRRVPSALSIFGHFPTWTTGLVLLALGCLIYTYAGTVSREMYRTTWLRENSVPFTLDGMAFMRVAYPADYAGITWLNAHVRGAQVIAEADDAYYNWRSRVSMFTGLPTIVNGIHEAEQRYGDELDPSQLCGKSSSPATCLANTHSRDHDLGTLYNATVPAEKWRVIRAYGVKYIYVGFSERQEYSHAGLATLRGMVGKGLSVAFSRPGVTIYRVTA